MKSLSENIDTILNIIKSKATEKGIKYVVVASTRGDTGVKTAEALEGTGIQVVVVTHQIGPQGPELLEVNEKKIKSLNAKIITCTHAFGGVSNSLTRFPPRESGVPVPQIFNPPYIPPLGDLIANVLRLFSQGMKVCVEITGMASDAGAVPIGENIIAVGGQGRGADTAIIIKTANTNHFFDLEIQEIIAKPIKKILPRPVQ